MWQHLTVFATPLYHNGGALRLLAEAITNLSIALLPVGYLMLWETRDSRVGLLLLYAALSWATAIFTARHIGANINYFFEPYMASVPIAAVAAWRLSELRLRTPIFVTGFVVFLLGFSILPKLVREFDLVRVTLTDSRATAGEPSGFSKFRAALAGKRILSVFPDSAVWSSRPELLDPYLNHVLEKARKWDSKFIVEDLQRETYEVVINSTEKRQYRGLDILSPRIQAAIDQSYVPYCKWQGMAFLLPKEQRPSLAETKERLSQAGCSLGLYEERSSVRAPDSIP